MFVEGKVQDKSKFRIWFEAHARRHPAVFAASLVVLAIGVTVGLLFKTNYTIVLYQGF